MLKHWHDNKYRAFLFACHHALVFVINHTDDDHCVMTEPFVKLFFFQIKTSEVERIFTYERKNVPNVLWIMARRCFSWSSVSDNFLFPSCAFLVILLALSFSCLILSISFLCSSVSDALLTFSFSFLSERFFFFHAKAALARSRNQ